MQYNFNGKIIVIPDAEIANDMKKLGIDENEAIELWLDDNGYTTNEEQEELDKTAKKVRIDKDVCVKSPTKERKKPEIKVSDEKKELFDEILSDLEDVYKGNVKVLTKNKLIEVKINGITFKIDVIQQRKPKS